MRFFPDRDGQDADRPVLKRIAEAINSPADDASDPRTIDF